MKRWATAIILLIISFLLVIFLSPYASDKPDGLEYVAERKGFLERTEGQEILKSTPLYDYSVQGIENEKAAAIIAGVVGVVVCLIVALGLGLTLKARKETN